MFALLTKVRDLCCRWNWWKSPNLLTMLPNISDLKLWLMQVIESEPQLFSPKKNAGQHKNNYIKSQRFRIISHVSKFNTFKGYDGPSLCGQIILMRRDTPPLAAWFESYRFTSPQRTIPSCEQLYHEDWGLGPNVCTTARKIVNPWKFALRKVWVAGQR